MTYTRLTPFYHTKRITRFCKQKINAPWSNIKMRWWAGVDSNHRKLSWQIYSLLPLATREPTHIFNCLELVNGIEPSTCWLQISCSAYWATPARYYVTITWCLGAESNHRHGDFQSPALPTELPRHIYERYCYRSYIVFGDSDGARTHDL